jgi:HEPN domain-containing protein
MRRVVGIDRKIKRAWLDKVLDQLATTTHEKELRAFLDRALKEELPGKESRAKSIGIVLRIWSGVPKERLALRDRAVALLPRITGQERLWLHWGMTVLAYPFFRDTAEVVGRLLALQDDFTTAQVQGRLVTAWGDRATSKEAAQKLLTTLVDWEVLLPTKTKGHFLLARKMTATAPELQLWLLEALLAASAAQEIEAQQLLRLPESFPFTLTIGIADLRRHESFNIHRQGLDMDMVALRKVRTEQPAKRMKRPRKAKGTTDKSPEPVLFEQESEEILTGNGQPRTAQEILTVLSELEREPLKGKHCSEDDSRKEAQESTAERPVRFQVREVRLLPDNPFSDTSAESARLFKSGDYYACVALTQAVLEALVHHVWQVNPGKKKPQDSDFPAILTALYRKGVVKEEWKTKLHEIWLNRHKFHHLRASVEADQQALEGMARANLNLLDELKEEFFGYDIQGERVVPNRPEYWSIKEGKPQVLTFD